MNQDLDLILYAGLASARAAEPSPADVRAVVARADRRRWRWRLRRKQSLVLVLAGLAISGGAAATLLDNDRNIDEAVRNHGAFPSSGDPALDRLIAEAKTRPELAPLANTFTVEAQVVDPAGGPPWVLVVWRSKSGGWCKVAARQEGGQIGSLAADGSMHAFPFHEGGVCTAQPLGPDDATLDATSYPAGPTVVYGVAGRDVARVRLSGLPGLSELATSKRGAFMAIIPEPVPRPRPKADLVLRDGTVRPGPGSG
jgi:hypothetical protein